MMQKALVGIAAGLLSALLMLAMLSATVGGVILTLLASLPLFGVGLAFGPVAVLVAGVSAGLATGIVAWPEFGAFYMLMIALPAIILSSQAVRRVEDSGSWQWSSGASLAMLLTAVGVVLFGLMAAQLSQTDPEAVVRGLFDEGAKLLVEQEYDQPGGQELTAAVAKIFAKLPALGIAVWLLVLAANGCLGQALAVRFEHQIRPTPAMTELGLPRWFAAVSVVLIAASVAGPGWIGFAARNLLVLQSVAYFFAGLAVLHSAVQHRRNKLALLLCAYVVVVFLLMMGSPLVLIVVAVGVVEPWARLRMRLAQARSS